MAESVHAGGIPRHIAIIMDGNGRWAKKRGLPRKAGHAAGAETFRKIATYCKDIGVEYFTVYAFSTENWTRPQDEVQAIMDLLEKYLKESIEKMEKDGIRLRILGDPSKLSSGLQALIRQTDAITERVQGMQVNVCLNYGGRDEILRAAKAWSQAGGEMTPEAFSRFLDTGGMPDPDLVIRPSGECRISNFLLWQSAYAEFYFTDVLWPDFSTGELDCAIESFRKRDRRYGGVRPNYR